MNSKQRRTERRKGLVKKIKEVKGASHSVAEMNDLCPKYFEKCGHPRQEFEFDKCHGRYETCKYFKR